jgi:periplasmic protein CpxP/Spy
MKLKLFSIIMALVALMLIPVVRPALAQMMTPGFPGLMQVLPDLNLTPEQEAQFTQLRENTAAQIEQILTPEQQQKFRTLKTQVESVRQSFAQLNLTPEQRQQIREVMRSNRPEIEQILTEEQRQQIRDRLQEVQHDR